MLFDWFEAIIYRHAVIDDVTSLNERIDEFRAAKKANSARLSQLLLVLFNAAGSSQQQSKLLIESYCGKLYRSLRVLGAAIRAASPRGDNLTRRRVAEENFQTYLYTWLDLLITSIKQWHKYKSVVKIIDFLVAYSFQTEMSDKFINLNMLNELFNYVRADFGVVLGANAAAASDSSADNSLLSDHHHLVSASTTDSTTNNGRNSIRINC